MEFEVLRSPLFTEQCDFERFSTLFGKEFDFEALKNGSLHPPPVDTPENLRFLAQIETSLDVHAVHVKIGEELSARLTLDRNIGGMELREKGNKLYKEGKLEEALRVYNEAILLNPFEVRNYTNAVVCLIGLGRNEEAMTIASIASDVEPRFAKVHLLMVKSCCNLGYVDSALTHGERLLDNCTPNELRTHLAEFQQLVREVPQERRKALDDRDFEETKRRLLSPDQGPPEVYTFLMEHLLELTAETVEKMTEKNFPIMLECMNTIPYLSKFIKDPGTGVTQLTPGECRVLGCFLTQLEYHCKDGLVACEKLLANATFAQFFPKLAFAFTKRSTIQANFTKFGPGFIFSCFFASFIYLLEILARYPAIRNGYIRETEPFNDLAFYVHLMALDSCAFKTRDSPDTNMFIETFTSIMCESWFIEKLEKSLVVEQFEHSISILATISTIFLQCRSENFRAEKPPFASFLPLWLKLSEHPTFCPIIVRRPGVWHHVATRLDYTAKDLKEFIAFDHHRAHLKETLLLFKNLTQQPLDSRIFASDEISGRLQTAFTGLLKFAGKKGKARFASFMESTAKSALEILTCLLENCPDFVARFLISNEEPVLQVLAMMILSKDLSTEISLLVFGCLKVLMKAASTAQLLEWVNTANFPSFVEKLVEILTNAGSESQVFEMRDFCVGILHTLIEAEAGGAEKTDRCLKLLATSNPYGLVKGIARFIQNSPACSSNNAELLLARLSSNIAFSDACSHLEGEMLHSVLSAVQQKLETCKSDDERKTLEGLVEILKI